MMISTRFQLFIDCHETERVKHYQQMLFSWQRITFRAANFINTHLYLQEQIKEMIYISEGAKVKLGDFKKDISGILNGSRINSTYRLLSEKFIGDIPTDILNALNSRQQTDFMSERKYYWTGEKSLPNYKRDINLPFHWVSLKRLDMTDDGREFKFNLFQIPFVTWTKTGYDKKDILRSVFRGKIKPYGCFLKLDKTRIYLYISYEPEVLEHDFDEGIIAEVSLSMENPLTVKIGSDLYTIGHKEEFFYRKLAIQASFKRAQQSINYNRSKNGKKRQRKNLERLSNTEHQYSESKLHLYSRRLIDLCINHRAGTILLVNQENKEEVAREDPFILRNWSFQGLKEKIEYKAKIAGINLIVE